MRYPIILTPDGDNLLVTCPHLPELTSFGEDETDALRMAQGAVEVAMAARLDGLDAPPRPSAEAGLAVEVSLQTAMKVQLLWALDGAGVNRAELGRRLDWHRPPVDRLFNPNHATRLDQYEAAFAALGRKVTVEVEAAAG